MGLDSYVPYAVEFYRMVDRYIKYTYVPPVVSWASVVFRDGSTYRLTSRDVLMAARMAVYEGGDAADTLWTMTQRFSFAKRQYGTFSALLEAFSQPINPIWSASGEMCMPGGQYAHRAECSEDKLQRRHEASHASMADLALRDPEAIQKVHLWANARLRNPVPTAVNFANPAVSQHYLASHPGSRVIKKAGNWFFAESGSERWGRNYVTMEHADGAKAGDRILADPSDATRTLLAFLAPLTKPLLNPFG
jgi:hypothetical protein